MDEAEALVTPEIVKQLKQAIHDVQSIWRGYGRIVVEMRSGRITRIGVEVWTWNRNQGRDDEC